MSVKQLSVFLENKEGKLKKAVNAMSQAGVNIRALSIADSSKYGILRLIVSDNEVAIKALKEEKFTVKETDVIVVGVKDEPNGLNTMLEILEKESINVEYLYAFVSSKTDEAIVVVKIENYEDGVKALKDADANLLSKEDLVGVLDLIIASTNKTLEPQKISVVVDPTAKQILIDKGYDPKMGARPMRRIVQKTVENIVASAILSGQATPGSTLHITPNDIEASQN